VVNHPIVMRARAGKAALAPEDPRFLVQVLSGGMTGGGFGSVGVIMGGGDGDVVMGDA
jgi:hypothetical protein